MWQPFRRRRDRRDATRASLSESQADLVSEARQPSRPGPQRPAAAPTAPRRRPGRLIVPWQPAELGRVRDGLPGRYQAMTDLGASLGLRQGELFGFNLDDLDQRAYRARVQIKRADGVLVFAPPKNDHERSVPVPASLHHLINTHVATYGTTRVTLPWIQPGGQPRTYTLLFANQHAAPLDRGYVNRLWKTAVLSAGIAWIPQDTGFHMLRHVAASEWIAAGADLLQVRDLLGHADTATTERYLHRLRTHDQRTRTMVAKAQRRTAARPARLPAGVADFAIYRNRRTS
jgi:integrase